MLAAGALVASLLAVGAGPAVALDEDSKPNKEAATSACVGDANEDMMFSDVSEGHSFRGDINCLAYYGVTVGYGDGTFQPNADVSNEEMVLFMERAAAVAGADAEAVVGDFAETGSDPVDRGDMALLIARLLVSATSDESAVNVKNNDDGTFTVDGVETKDWDYFADSRRSQNRVSDSAASALYELGVAKGTGMGYFSPAATVSRGAMAAFITRALAHTSARPSGVTIQSDGPGEVIISVRDANFQPVANAALDVFSADTDKVDGAFNADGSCNKPRGEGGNAKPCEIDALDAITGLSGDYDPGAITVNAEGGTTVWAWTGDTGDKVEDGSEGLASVNLTETNLVTATNTKVTNDLGMGVTRASFGSTVTVTIQLVGANDADAGPADGGASYEVVTRRISETDVASTGDPAALPAAPATVDDSTANVSAKATQVLKVDASGKATFTITASDPDTTDRNNLPADNKADRVHVAYAVTAPTGLPLATDITGSSGTGVITFSDERGVATSASVKKPAASYLAAPTSGVAANVVTVTVVDQFGKPVPGYEVWLDSNLSTDLPDRLVDGTDLSSDTSSFPAGRKTDSSGTVRIGYSHSGSGSVETLTAHTKVAGDPATYPRINTGDEPDASFYWVAATTAQTALTALNEPVVRVFDADSNTLVIGATDNTGAPLLVRYDDNDQFVIGTANKTMADFEAQLAMEDDTADGIVVTSYNPRDASTVARFALTVNLDS